jgi:two-component system sensor kinase FixL
VVVSAPCGRRRRAPGLILLEIDDVSERKQREEALLASESKLRAIVDAAADGVVTIDEGEPSRHSTAAERCSATGREVVGRSVWTLMPPTHMTSTPPASGAIGGRGREGHRDDSGAGRPRNDRTTFPMELSVGEYHDGARGFVGIVRDVSERKKAEEAAERQQVELEARARLGAMGEIAASLGHELSQPLSVVANTLEVVTRLRSGPVWTPTLIRLSRRRPARSSGPAR